MDLAWNPEFLREGYAVQDSLTPDRFVFGVTSETAARLLRAVYAKPLAAGIPALVMDLETAELVKVSANAFLATKISFINAMAAFATFDAMSLFLMSAAVWCVITAANRDDSTWLLIAASVLLTLANATKYATTLFDPSIVALGGLVVAKDRGRKSAAGRAGLVAACTMALDAALLAVGGDAYVTGLLSTTVSRVAGGSPPSVVLSDAAQWIGIACIPAAISAVVALSRREDRVQAAIVALLAVSGTLAPLNQARIHTTTSLSKHVDFGAWFVAVAGGYLIAQLARIGWRWRAGWVAGAATAVLVSAAVLVPAAAFGERQSGSFFQAWPDSSADYLRASVPRPGASRPLPHRGLRRPRLLPARQGVLEPVV